MVTRGWPDLPGIVGVLGGVGGPVRTVWFRLVLQRRGTATAPEWVSGWRRESSPARRREQLMRGASHERTVLQGLIE